MPDWTIVVPVKGTASAKSRLGASPELALAIALDSVEGAVFCARVIVVTTPDAAPAFAELGVEVVLDADGGLLAACRQGIAAAGNGPVAVMLGDLPGLRPFQLRHVLESAARHSRAFVPDSDNQGTTLITALKAADHRPAFGAGSRGAHLAAGYVELTVPASSGIRRDVDTPEQLAEIPREWLGRRTRAILAARQQT